VALDPDSIRAVVITTRPVITGWEIISSIIEARGTRPCRQGNNKNPSKEVVLTVNHHSLVYYIRMILPK